MMAFRRLRRSFGRSVPPAAEAEMGHVSRLLLNGRYGAAANLLEEMARRAALMDSPGAAAELHARAAHCFVSAGMEPAALGAARAALRLFTDLGMTERYARFLENMTRRMRTRNMPDSAGALLSLYGDQPLPVERSTAQPEGEKPAHPRLPPACPQCGAPLKPDEVGWIDANSAECAYCGGMVTV
jgi:hypothetical protein